MWLTPHTLDDTDLEPFVSRYNLRMFRIENNPMCDFIPKGFLTEDTADYLTEYRINTAVFVDVLRVAVTVSCS
jgi:hypothetical protein